MSHALNQFYKQTHLKLQTWQHNAAVKRWKTAEGQRVSDVFKQPFTSELRATGRESKSFTFMKQQRGCVRI